MLYTADIFTSSILFVVHVYVSTYFLSGYPLFPQKAQSCRTKASFGVGILNVCPLLRVGKESPAPEVFRRVPF